MLYGGRLSLGVGVVSVGIALTGGLALGVLAGFWGGWRDTLIMRAMDVLLAFPRILLALAIIAVLGPGLPNVMVAVGISHVPQYTRVVRSSVLSTTNDLYVDAARAIGCGDRRVMDGCVLMEEWVDGTPLPHADGTPEHVVAAATLLASLHSVGQIERIAARSMTAAERLERARRDLALLSERGAVSRGQARTMREALRRFDPGATETGIIYRDLRRRGGPRIPSRGASSRMSRCWERLGSTRPVSEPPAHRTGTPRGAVM